MMKLYVRYSCIGITALLLGICMYEYWPSRVEKIGLTAAERKYDELRARFGDGHIVQGGVHRAGNAAVKGDDAMQRGTTVEVVGVNPFGIQPIPKEIFNGRIDVQAGGEDKPVRVFARSRHDFGSFGYNVERSDHIAHFRALPNSKNKNCPNRTIVSGQNGERSVRVSVIIYLYNEALSVLLRTVYSVINRTPTHLLQEIILMDDTSDFEELQKALEVEMKQIVQVRLLRNDLHMGQPISKNTAARNARGDVLVFVCSRCEVNDGWIEPLVAALGFGGSSAKRVGNKHPVRIAAPVLDNIEMNTFGYEKAPVLYAGFSWNLLFTWQSVPQHILSNHRVEYSNDLVEPFESATFHGAVVAMSADTFKFLGGFDEALESWGIIGEDSIDFSLKTWLCGGQVFIVPCSRVGYVYAERNPFNQLPPGHAVMDTYTFNTLRAAHIWFDNSSLAEFYKWNPSAARSKRFGNLTSAMQFKLDHDCKSFDWLVRNIYPELDSKRYKSSRSDPKAPAGPVGQPEVQHHVAEPPPVSTRSGKLQLRTKVDDADGKVCLSLIDRSQTVKEKNKLGSPDDQNERWFAKLDLCNTSRSDQPAQSGRYDLVWKELHATGYRNSSSFVELRTRWAGITQALCLTVSETKEQTAFVGMGSLHRVVARACQEDLLRQVWRWRPADKSDRMMLETTAFDRKCLAVKQVRVGEAVYVDECSEDHILQLKFLAS